jgi:hypothetical protein
MRPGAARNSVRDRPQVIWMAWMVLFVAEGGMMGNFGVRPLCRKWVIPDSNGRQERGTDPGSSSIRELGCGTDNLPPRCPPRLLSRYTFEAPDYLGDFGKRTTPFRDCTPKCLVVAGGPKITLILEQGTSMPSVMSMVTGD